MVADGQAIAEPMFGLGLLDVTVSDNVFLKYGVRTVVDGKGPAHIESELVRKIVALEYSGERLLESLIITQGLFDALRLP